MTVQTLIHSARILGAEDADWVLFASGRVAQTGSGDSWRELERFTLDAKPKTTGAMSAKPDEIRVVDATAIAGADAVLTPGFIDLHVHGGGGHAHEDGADAIVAAREFHRAHGTTRAVVSFVTSDIPALLEHVQTAAELVGRVGILGSHLEGPFLAPERRGAHDPRLLREPAADILASLLRAGDGTVRQVTIAPELPGGLEAVRTIVAAGAVCAVGHTEADRDLATAAFDAGATLLTHTFNAMPPLLHRAPGPIGAALSNDSVTLELIVDDTHVHADLVRMVAAAAPGRTALVTDAMAATGMPDGDYRLSSLEVEVRDGVARLREGGAIAGSTLTQDDALRRAVRGGVPLPDAVDALTRTPARVLGLNDHGALNSGYVADAVLLTSDLHVRGVWADGELVAGAA